jgi:hypothetical protein
MSHFVLSLSVVIFSDDFNAVNIDNIGIETISNEKNI